MVSRIAILASGSGSNAENIVRHFTDSDLARVVLVLTNRREAGVVARMESLGVKTLFVSNDIWDNSPERIVELLHDDSVDIVALAGFLHYLSPVVVNAFVGRVLNIHPSLLPAYGGKGMWGRRVHEAVIAAGETESGATVHLVSDEMDGGEIVMSRKVPVLPGDTAAVLESRVHQVEYLLYPEAIEMVLSRLSSQIENAN